MKVIEEKQLIDIDEKKLTKSEVLHKITTVLNEYPADTLFETVRLRGIIGVIIDSED